jgi:predicted nucleic acid-binding protein
MRCLKIDLSRYRGQVKKTILKEVRYKKIQIKKIEDSSNNTNTQGKSQSHLNQRKESFRKAHQVQVVKDEAEAEISSLEGEVKADKIIAGNLDILTGRI